MKKLSDQGIQLNVTAIFTLGQVRATVPHVSFIYKSYNLV
ncbi:MAG: hypothetical protein IJ828_01585 [Treponema sp.]|nr:hypothetical protein [Treponema sp.]